MNAENLKTIGKIAERAMPYFEKHGIKTDGLSIIMDIEYTNEVNPLRLDELLNADEENFLHDVFGIYCHFNRQTKKLEDCFVPRYSCS